MVPPAEKSSLKRALGSAGDDESMKKPRRSDVSFSQQYPNSQQAHLPSPVTNQDISTASGGDQPRPRSTKSPSPSARDRPQTPESSSLPSQLQSPPSDTQPFSQFITPAPFGYQVEEEEANGVWGYLIPLDGPPVSQDAMVLKRRAACPMPDHLEPLDGRKQVGKEQYVKEEDEYEKQKISKRVPAGGYLIGRHPECDRIIDLPTVSNRHCLFFTENKLGDSIAVLEDLSQNGTYVNDTFVGRNKRRELNDGDQVSILDAARFVFRYPRNHESSGFRQQYQIKNALGKGHFATVYLCTEKSTGTPYAVKHFERRVKGPNSAQEEKSKVDGLQQEIAVLMSVSHPNMLCLKDTFNERDGVYMVLELAPEGELFNWIVMKQKLSEADTRKIFVQLFQGIKYMHERNIVHRDIKPENILLMDKNLDVKIADFGLAKIIGEESFTATLCGTPSYVAPEILEQGNRRRYTRAVDVWSLGVVLYICLCGFPPFSDELYSQSNPYTLSQQIKMGRFDYPSPYWDSVGDPALDLIDRMLTVDVNKRITIDECLEHPWTTGRVGGAPGHDGVIDPSTSMESTEGLAGALGNLDFSHRKPKRERTLLSSINDISLTKVINLSQKDQAPSVKVYDKNPTEKGRAVTKERMPADNRNPEEFARMGGNGDEPLFGNDNGSVYQDQTMKNGKSP